jgi:hypothetical protein
MTIRGSGRSAILVTLVLALAGCATATPPPDAPDAARAPAATSLPLQAPSWQVGDRWTYEWTSGKDSGVKSVEVVAARDIGTVRYLVVRLGDSEHYYTEALHWAAASREGKVEARMVPPQPWFVWPLTAGARWSGQSRFEHREGAVVHADRFAVVGVEPVEVPAGRYQAIKLTRETDRRDVDEYWYAPEVRWYVRWVGRRGDVQFEERLREYRPVPRSR